MQYTFSPEQGRGGVGDAVSAEGDRIGGGGAGLESLGYVPALDGLRALAVLAVLGYHAGFDWLKGGFLGVSAFFTLSGFLVTSLLLREWDRSDSVDLSRFWSRRFRRLLPASWSVIAAVVLLGVLGAWTDGQLRSLRLDVPTTLGEVYNWRLIIEGVSYEDTVAAPSPLKHFWSLAVEQQFYVLLPLLLAAVFAFATRRRRTAGSAPTRGTSPLVVLVVVFAVLAAVSMFANWAFARTSVDRAYLGTDTRAAEMLIGALVAVLASRRLRARSDPVRRFAVGAGVVGLVVLGLLASTTALEVRWLYPWGLAANAICTTAVIMAVLQRSWLATAMSVGPLVYIGRISYGVYLVHWPVFLVLTPQRTGWNDALLLAVRVGLTIAIAALSYQFWERPVRSGDLLSTATVRRAVPAAAVLLVLGTLLVTSGLPPEPDYLRTEEEVELEVREVPSTAASPTPEPATEPTDAVDVPSPEAPATTAPAPELPPPVRASRVLFLGDSIAASLEDDLGDVLVDLGVSYGAAAAPGCGLITGFPTDEQGRVSEMTRPCDDAIPRRQLETVAEVEPDLVVAMSSWEMTNREVDGVWYPFGSPESDEVLLGLFDETVNRLTATGAKVALVLMPEVVEGREQAVGPEEVERGRHLNELLEQVAQRNPGRVTTIDLASRVCPQEPCPTVVDGMELRGLDGRHFDDPAAARLVSTWLAADALALDLATLEVR